MKSKNKKTKSGYSKPIIAAVQLHSDQAILAACVVGGAFVNASGPNWWCWPAGNLGGSCDTAVKGVVSGNSDGSSSSSDIPS